MMRSLDGSELAPSTLRCEGSRHGFHGGFAEALGLIGHRAHLGLEKFRLDPHRILSVIGIYQLVTEVERRRDVALHEFRELLGMIGDRQLRGTKPLLFRTRSRFSVSMARTFSADIASSVIAPSYCQLPTSQDLSWPVRDAVKPPVESRHREVRKLDRAA